MDTTTELNERVCGRCGKSKPKHSFYNTSAFLPKHMYKVGKKLKKKIAGWCTSCVKEWGTETHRYNTTGCIPEQYVTMLEQQDHCCAICGKHEFLNNKALAMDHEHKTGKIRGLLCTNCNVGLGNFKDNPEFLNKAIKYLS